MIRHSIDWTNFSFLKFAVEYIFVHWQNWWLFNRRFESIYLSLYIYRFIKLMEVARRKTTVLAFKTDRYIDLVFWLTIPFQRNYRDLIMNFFLYWIFVISGNTAFLYATREISNYKEKKKGTIKRASTWGAMGRTGYTCIRHVFCSLNVLIWVCTKINT